MLCQILFLIVRLAADVDTPFTTLTREHQPGGKLQPGIGHKLSPAELDAIRTGSPVPPSKAIHAGVKMGDGTLWIGSQLGLFTRKPGDARWRFYHSRRWLLDDNVTDVSVSKDGVVQRANAGRNYAVGSPIANVDAKDRRY